MIQVVFTTVLAIKKTGGLQLPLKHFKTAHSALLISTLKIILTTNQPERRFKLTARYGYITKYNMKYH